MVLLLSSDLCLCLDNITFCVAFFTYSFMSVVMHIEIPPPSLSLSLSLSLCVFILFSEFICRLWLWELIALYILLQFACSIQKGRLIKSLFVLIWKEKQIKPVLLRLCVLCFCFRKFQFNCMIQTFQLVWLLWAIEHYQIWECNRCNNGCLWYQ